MEASETSYGLLREEMLLLPSCEILGETVKDRMNSCLCLETTCIRRGGPHRR